MLPSWQWPVYDQTKPVLCEHLRASWEELVLLSKPTGPKATPQHPSCCWSHKPPRTLPDPLAQHALLCTRARPPASGTGKAVAGSLRTAGAQDTGARGTVQTRPHYTPMRRGHGGTVPGPALIPGLVLIPVHREAAASRRQTGLCSPESTLHCPLLSISGSRKPSQLPELETGVVRDPQVGAPSMPHCPPLETAPSSACQSGSACTQLMSLLLLPPPRRP